MQVRLSRQVIAVAYTAHDEINVPQYDSWWPRKFDILWYRNLTSARSYRVHLRNPLHGVARTPRKSSIRVWIFR
jgi:hypothetical protein